MYDYFFHSLNWDNDVYIMYIVWAVLVPVSLYFVRFLYKTIRKPKLRSRFGEFYMTRDLFLKISGQEYLIVYTILYAIYLGVWVYLVAPFSQKEVWSDWHTYLIVLPQFVTLLTIVILFIIRNNRFCKPLIK